MRTAPPAEPPASALAPLVSVRDMTVTFVSKDATVHAVNGVSFTLDPGEVLVILGESGSGKSVSLRPDAASAAEEDADRRLNLDRRQERTRDGRAGARGPPRQSHLYMIFQEPMTALDPVFTIGRQIAETIIRHEGVSRAAAERRALELLELVQIPSTRRRLASYPHELSGGLRQRAMIAIALACRPKLLLADVPTTALDATVQIQILLRLRKLQRELGMGVIFVTHDLGVAGEIADRVVVMYAGCFVDEGPVTEVMLRPLHPYTQGLMGSTVRAGLRGTRLAAIPGAPPDLARLPEGCAFAPRFTFAEAACRASLPDERRPVPFHMARCLRVDA